MLEACGFEYMVILLLVVGQTKENVTLHMGHETRQDRTAILSGWVDSTRLLSLCVSFFALLTLTVSFLIHASWLTYAMAPLMRTASEGGIGSRRSEPLT